MEKKTAEQYGMILPMYKDQVPLSGKRWIVGMGLVVLLVGTNLAITLFGVYMTQKHTERTVTLVLNVRDGQKVQQTISDNKQENMAAIFVRSKNNFTTMMYDYERNIIGIRTMNSSVCSVLRMDKFKIPPIQDILRQMDNKASSDDQITYSVIPVQKANHIDVGTSVNIFCTNIDIYWGKLVFCEDVEVLGPAITFTFSFSISIAI
ncbi:gastrokine-2-like [Hyla sarda]|uniref:gastrokine-2-like n=1 Tax=Hyla sarda TaxID=327740 RepID=UPI0024C3C542|nr:gastrokine-2-like [Hyla sarda]XP_056397841.1 gastrokine-2-like [Hyla sarda]